MNVLNAWNFLTDGTELAAPLFEVSQQTIGIPAGPVPGYGTGMFNIDDLGGGQIAIGLYFGVNNAAYAIVDVSSNNWLTLGSDSNDAATFTLALADDGTFAVFSVVAQAYLAIDRSTIVDNCYQIRATAASAADAIRFTAKGLWRSATLDFLQLNNAASGLSFAGLNIAGMDLTNAALQNSDFAGVTDMTGCNFTNANLSSANLAGQALGNVSFAGANLTEANLAGCTLGQVDLSGATIAGTNLTGCDLSTATVSKPVILSTNPDTPTLLVNATLNYDLLGLDWSCVDMTGATMAGQPANLDSLNAQAAHLPNWSFVQTSLVGANFAGATLDGAQFHYAKLQNAVFNGAQMPDADFSDTVLQNASFVGAAAGGVSGQGGAKFSNAYIGDCDFTDANLYQVNFSAATFVGDIKLSGAANLLRSDFSNAYLPGVTFAGAVMQGAIFDNAFMVQCDLQNVDLSPANDGAAASSLNGACLQAVNFQNTNLNGADLNNAMITDTAGMINQRYFDQDGELTPWFPLPYPAGTLPAVSSLGPDTICPNGVSYRQNNDNGLTLAQMMTAAQPTTQWQPPGAVADGRAECADDASA